MSRVPCSLGYTMVCGNSASRIKNDADMVSSCPNAPDTRKEDVESCACLPTMMVEEALEKKANPLGKDRAGCVKVEGNMILKGLEGVCYTIISSINKKVYFFRKNGGNRFNNEHNCIGLEFR